MSRISSYSQVRNILEKGNHDEFTELAHTITTRSQKMLLIAALVLELTDCLWHAEVIKTRATPDLDDDDALAEERSLWQKLTGMSDFADIFMGLEAACKRLPLFDVAATPEV